MCDGRWRIRMSLAAAGETSPDALESVPVTGLQAFLSPETSNSKCNSRDREALIPANDPNVAWRRAERRDCVAARETPDRRAVGPGGSWANVTPSPGSSWANVARRARNVTRRAGTRPNTRRQLGERHPKPWRQLGDLRGTSPDALGDISDRFSCEKQQHKI